ncbi:COP23 domain-containing protein [Altericista sp. CCNU0014]|uniref:COP23 domain-containing protein n=1 Tax=Altericista sp. CCNU0014 TaxID=3082949 RepID=UPI00384C0D7D
MKSILLQAAAVAALGLTCAMTRVVPAQAEPQSGSRFFCGKSQSSAAGDEIPTTIARTQRGNVLMIRWKSSFFANGLNNYTPESRCLEVSRRFQTFYDSGTLAFLTTGKANGQNVICVAEEYGGSCKGLLLTLEPKDNPQQVLQDLMDVRVRARGPITRGADSTYIDVEEFLDTAPVQEDTLSVSPAVRVSPKN